MFFEKKIMNLPLKAPFMMMQLWRNQQLEPQELKKLQEKKLRAMVKHSYENVAYYHERFRRANLKPDDVRTMEDLAKIPILTKKTLKSLPTEKIVARNIDLNSCTMHPTSGTSGTPLIVYWDKTAQLELYLRS